MSAAYLSRIVCLGLAVCVLGAAAPATGLAAGHTTVVNGWNVDFPAPGRGVDPLAGTPRASVAADGTATFAWYLNDRPHVSSSAVEQITPDGTVRRLHRLVDYGVRGITTSGTGALFLVGADTTLQYPNPKVQVPRGGGWSPTSFGKIGPIPRIVSLSPTARGGAVLTAVDNRKGGGSTFAVYDTVAGSAARFVGSTDGFFISEDVAWTAGGATAIFVTDVQSGQDGPFLPTLAEVGAAPRTTPLAGVPALGSAAVETSGVRLAVAGASLDLRDGGLPTTGAPVVAIGTVDGLPAFTRIPNGDPSRPGGVDVAFVTGGAIVTWLQKASLRKGGDRGVPHWAFVSDAGLVGAQGTLSPSSASSAPALHTVGGRALATWAERPGSSRSRLRMAVLDGATATPLTPPPGRPWEANPDLDLAVTTNGDTVAAAVIDGQSGRVTLATRVLPTR